MEHHTTTSRAEAERLLGIAEKLLRTKEFGPSRDFAILAQETEPLLDGSDQILAVAEVLLAAETKRRDWYSILQIPHRTDDLELIKKQYRRYALLLHPDKNKFPFSDSAFRLVADSWAVLSDPAKKAVYDNEFQARFTKVDLVAMKDPQFNQQRKQQSKEDNSNQKLPVRRSGRSGSGGGGTPASAGGGIRTSTRTSDGNLGSTSGNFWTACPYCYNLYEYSRVYDGCCLRCDNENCKRTFTATEVLSLPPLVPGKEAYYCCWGFFPMGFVAGNVDEFPKWMPPMFGTGAAAATPTPAAAVDEDVGRVPPPPPPPENVTPVPAAAPAGTSTAKKKRGRPKKNI